MADEKEMVMVEFNGQQVPVEKNSRLHKQIANLLEKTQEEAFADQRQLFLDATQPVVEEQMTGFADVLNGMALVYDFDQEAPVLVRASLVKIGKREGKTKES